MKQISRLAVGIVIVSLCMLSCKSSKEITGSTKTTKVDSPDMFSSRLKLILPQEKKDQTINGSVKLLRNELIQLSLVAPVLRVEAVRIEITPNEVLIIDRIHKQYTVASIAELQNLFGSQMNYQQLQDNLMEAVFLKKSSGWRMKGGNAKAIFPVHTPQSTEKIVMLLNRITIPKQKPIATNPPPKYERKELTELIKSIEEIE